MAADFTNIGLILAIQLRILGLSNDVWNFFTQVNGNDRARDLLDDAFDFTSTAQEDLNDILNALVTTSNGPSIAGEQATFRDAVIAGMAEVLKEQITVTDADLDAGAAEFIYDNALLALGQIELSDTIGWMGALKKSMETDSKQIKQNVVAFGSLTERATTTGKLVLTASASTFYLLGGTITFEVVDDTIENPRLTVSHELTNNIVNLASPIVGENQLQVGQNYNDLFMGLKNTKLDLDTPVILFETAATNVFSVLTITNPSEATTDKGKLFPKVTRLASDTWLVEIFRLASLTSIQGSDASAIGTVGTSALVIQIPGGQVAVTIDLAALDVELPLVGDTYEGVQFDIRSPLIGDAFELTNTNDESSNFGTLIAKTPALRAELPSGAVESIEFNDANAAPIEIP